MRKQLFAVMLAAAVPLAAFARGTPNASAPTGEEQGHKMDPERMAKRMRLARTLGLAEVLDLDAPAALKLGDSLAKLDDRRIAAHKTMHDSREVLRRAAKGEKVSAADVDQAIQKALDARAQLQAVDRETVSTVTQGLTPEKKARAVLFLARFQHRFPGPGGFGHGMGPGGHMGPGMHGGHGPGGGPGGGFGMGPSEDGQMVGMAPPAPFGDFDDEPED
jgi:hypothetical protein